MPCLNLGEFPNTKYKDPFILGGFSMVEFSQLILKYLRPNACGMVSQRYAAQGWFVENIYISRFQSC